MKRIITLLAIYLATAACAGAQVFKVDTIAYSGDINKYINIVVVGDGYTSTQQDSLIKHVKHLSAHVFTQAPWANYKGYFNVFAIRVISADSGAVHPNTASDCAGTGVPVLNPKTYLGCAFDNYNIHRLITTINLGSLANVLAKNFPAYDLALVIANSPYYGGSGGTYPTISAHTSSGEIAAHELGHSFAGLADEYYAGDVYASEQPNMTNKSNVTAGTVKWKSWIGTGGVGTYQHCCGNNSAQWYKPTQNACKMELLSVPFCAVCGETIVESIHKRVNPIVSFLPAEGIISPAQQKVSFRLTELMKPQPNTLNIIWRLGPDTIARNVDSVIIDQSKLASGTTSLTVAVTDTTSFLRIPDHGKVHVSKLAWYIKKTATGMGIQPSLGQLSYSVYPNPASDLLNISVDLEKRSSVAVDIYAADGRLVRTLPARTLPAGDQLSSINITALAPGTYIIALKVDGFTYSQQWVKK